MAIDFSRSPISSNTARSVRGNVEQREQAQVWMNIGYSFQGEAADGSEDRFISLPVGIPLDTMEPVEIRGENEDYRAFSAARNDLLSQLTELAKSLQPGEDRMIGLEIQLRRVKGANTSVPTENKYQMKLAV